MALAANSAARSLSQHYGDPSRFRMKLLEILFALGRPTREQALSLEAGDALCVRTSGGQEHAVRTPLVLLAVDLEPPTPQGLGHRPWPAALQSLGGPAVALAWLSALGALVDGPCQRPWHVVYLRGPALGLPAAVPSLLADLPAFSQIIQLVPVSSKPWAGPALDLLRLDLLRPKNIWRFPACDWTGRVRADWTGGEPLVQLRKLLKELPATTNWTLHDLRLAPGRMEAVLRASAPVQPGFGLEIQEMVSDAHLLFPVNDALLSLQTLQQSRPAFWDGAEAEPLWAQVLPDGLRLHRLVAHTSDQLELPEKIGTMQAHSWQEPLCEPAAPDCLRVAVTAKECHGPVPTAMAGSTVCRVPNLADEVEISKVIGGLRARLLSEG